MLNRFNPGDAYPWLLILFLLFHIGSAAFIGLRFGILAMTVGLFYFLDAANHLRPLGLYAGSSEVYVLLMAGLAIYGCYRSLGKRQLVAPLVEASFLSSLVDLAGKSSKLANIANDPYCLLVSSRANDRASRG